MNFLILSDGRAGHINQSIALAKHCHATYEVVTVSFTCKLFKALSYVLDFLNIYSTSLFKMSKPHGKNFDTIVSAGSNTYYANKTLSKIYGLKSITMMLPKGYQYDFDTIFAQVHDKPPKKKNIISLPANMSFTEPQGLFTPSQKTIGIIIGGDNAIFSMQEERLKKQLDFIVETFKDYDIALRRHLEHHHV
ncbi:MAG: mitochondrial fission ELM1 family protein [Campylobacteraceae bacterium]|nr:mitochondrial fission ELM1 family protein [Campylobacteraceae bacterium]